MEDEEGIDDSWVVHRAATIFDDLKRIIVCEPRPVRPVGRQRVEAIDNRENPRADGDISSLQASGIACAVPVFVMVTNYRNDWLRKIDGGEDVSTNRSMKFHPLEFGWS